LPGLWALVGTSALVAWLVPEDLNAHLSWGWVIALAVLAGLGELLEFLAGALGVGKLGGSRRSAALALVGSFAGAAIGFFLGIPLPIPLLGAVLSSILFSGVGALIGASSGEYWKKADAQQSLKIGVAAFVGRVLGTLGKVSFGAVMAVMFVVGVWT
jgi:hypothetical protein